MQVRAHLQERLFVALCGLFGVVATHEETIHTQLLSVEEVNLSRVDLFTVESILQNFKTTYIESVGGFE